MASRQFEIVRIVQERPGVTQAELAHMLGVSERTIRSDIQKANSYLKGTAHISHHRSDGYDFVIDDAIAYSATDLPDMLIARALPSMPNERVSYLLKDLLKRDGWITLDELAARLYVSRASISGDLRVVERSLSRFGLSISRRPRYGICVEGPEVSRRLCLASLVLDGRFDQDEIGTALADVSVCLHEALEESGFKVSPAAYDNLVVHIAVALRRLMAGNVVSMPMEDIARLKETSAFYAAQRVCARIGERHAVVVPEEETAYLAMHLVGRQVVDDKASQEMGLVISDEIWAVVGDMLAIVQGAFGIDFGGDLELRMNLACHIVPLSVRLQHHMRIQNPLVDEIQENYPLAWSMAKTSSPALRKAFGSAPSDEEVGYVALTFALALERQRSMPVKKSIAIVCASGQGVARLLKHRFLIDFGPWVGSVQTCDPEEVGAIDFSQIDYVFTTVPLPEALPVPVCRVSTFLDGGDVVRVRNILEGAADSESALDSFAADLFFPHLRFGSKDEVLDFLCAEIESRRTVHGDLRQLIEARELIAETSFGNDVAMPHPIDPVADRTFVCVALLDDAVEWDSHPVRAVFLVCITREDVALDNFYRILTPILGSSEAIARLVAHQDWQTLCALLRESALQGGDEPA